MENLAEQGRRLLEEYVSERDVDKAWAKLWNDGSRQVVRAFLEATAQREQQVATAESRLSELCADVESVIGQMVNGGWKAKLIAAVDKALAPRPPRKNK